MEKRPLGATGLRVSPLGFGTVKVGRNYKVKNACGDGFELPGDALVSELLDICIEGGVNLLDTAPAYGVAEERLGQLLGTRRDQFVIVTKTGEEFDGKASEYNFSPKHTIMSVHRSLKRLHTDRLDCVLIHSNGDDMTILEQSGIVDTLVSLKEKGDILSFGMSTKTVDGGKKCVDLCDVVMVTTNPTYTAEDKVIEYAFKKNKGVLIKKGFLSGFLEKIEGDAVTACLQHALGKEGVSSIICGTLNPDHLQENIRKTVSVLSA